MAIHRGFCIHSLLEIRQARDRANRHATRRWAYIFYSTQSSTEDTEDTEFLRDLREDVLLRLAILAIAMQYFKLPLRH
jgi:hypothetical protein